MTTLHLNLVNAVTEYDRKQSTKKGYNPYALGHYIQAIHNIDEAIAEGMDPRKAIIANFIGRLLDAALKACGMEKATDAEHRRNRF